MLKQRGNFSLSLGLQHGMKVKEDLLVEPPQNLKEILSRARGFVKLKEKNSHYWGNVIKGRDSCKETIGSMERDRSIARDLKFQM